jgi:hypothetical protein
MLRSLPVLTTTLAVVASLLADDPPKEEKAKRPTTKEEFAALAKQYPLPPWMPVQGRDSIKDNRMTGTVVSVSAEHIEVLPEGKKEAVKMPPHVLLASGAICHYETDAKCYLLDDVQKGDVVYIIYGTADQEKGLECFTMSILERPGGTIPPSRKLSPCRSHQWHIVRQAQLDAKKKDDEKKDDKK